MFEVGDAVVHPTHGAGVVEEINERTQRGKRQEYYTIRLLSQTRTHVMLPVQKAENIGVRKAIARSRLDELWAVLEGEGQSLPDNNKTRYRLLHEKIGTMDPLKVAEVVRDMVWRRREKPLKVRGKQIYRKALRFLISEVAAAQTITISKAEAQVRSRLHSE